MYALTRMSRGGIKCRLTGNDSVEEAGVVCLLRIRCDTYVRVHVVQAVNCHGWSRLLTTIRLVPCMPYYGWD